MDDVFCKIVAGEIPSEYRLLETEALIVIKDIAPKAPVHYLVIPKKHIATIDEATQEDVTLLGAMVLAGQEVAQKSGVAGAYKLFFNVGERGGQKVPHIHLHVLGGGKMEE